MRESRTARAQAPRQGYGLAVASRSVPGEAPVPAGRGAAGIKPKYLESDASRHRWLISYTDLMTLLLIFFVAASAKTLNHPQSNPSLYSPAVKDKVRFTTVWAGAPVKPQPEHSPTPLTPREGLVRAERALARQGLNLKMEPWGLVISLPQAVFFASGRDQVSATALPVVASIAAVLRDIPNKVSLAGHADAVPIRTREFRNNWELASARGMRLLELLSEEYGIPESRLSVASFGANEPKKSNATEAGRASNRRVEIVIQDERSSGE